MKRQHIALAFALAAALTVHATADVPRYEMSNATTSTDRRAAERYHYSLNARVRPLVVFWITRANVGDAVATRACGREGATYSLLIGSDPERAPLHINRWVGSSRVDLQACKLEYSIVSPK